MNETFLLRIDVARLRRRLTSHAGRELSNGDAFHWLRSQGFYLAPGSWAAVLPALHALEPGEIIASNRLEDRASG